MENVFKWIWQVLDIKIPLNTIGLNFSLSVKDVLLASFAIFVLVLFVKKLGG